MRRRKYSIFPRSVSCTRTVRVFGESSCGNFAICVDLKQCVNRVNPHVVRKSISIDKHAQSLVRSRWSYETCPSYAYDSFRTVAITINHFVSVRFGIFQVSIAYFTITATYWKACGVLGCNALRNIGTNRNGNCIVY